MKKVCLISIIAISFISFVAVVYANNGVFWLSGSSKSCEYKSFSIGSGGELTIDINNHDCLEKTNYTASGSCSLSDLAQKDTKKNGYGLGSNKTLRGTWGGQDVYVVDPAGNAFSTPPNNANGKSPGSFNSGWSKTFREDQVYAVRFMTKKDYQTASFEYSPIQWWDGDKPLNQGIAYTFAISRDPGKMTSEFGPACEVERTGGQTSIRIISEEARKGLSSQITNSACVVPKNTKIYLNARPTNDTVRKCKDETTCAFFLKAQSIVDYSATTNAYSLSNYSYDDSICSSGSSTYSSSSTSSSSSSYLASLDPNPLHSYNNDYKPYASKTDLNPIALSNGKTLYIVNPGYSTGTSVPSCVNGKYMQTGCKPTGWTMGMVSDEIFAVRYKTKQEYEATSILFSVNGKSGGKTTRANYNYNISDKPGDMTGTSFEGRCNTFSENSDGGLYTTVPGLQPYVGRGYYCEVPKDTVFYLNVEVANNSRAICDTGICSGYINANGFQIAERVGDGATF